MREKANDNGRLDEAGILSRRGLQIVIKWLGERGLWHEGILSRLGVMRDRTPPVARVGLAPLPDARNVGGACEVIAVRRLV